MNYVIDTNDYNSDTAKQIHALRSNNRNPFKKTGFENRVGRN